VNLQFETFVHAAKHAIESQAAIAANLQLHEIAWLHAVIVSVHGIHVNVAQGANDPEFHLKESGRPHQHAADRAFDVAGAAERQFISERDAVRVSQFNLIDVSAGSENSKI
jgi:hypothetical protein